MSHQCHLLYQFGSELTYLGTKPCAMRKDLQKKCTNVDNLQIVMQNFMQMHMQKWKNGETVLNFHP